MPTCALQASISQAFHASVAWSLYAGKIGSPEIVHATGPDLGRGMMVSPFCRYVFSTLSKSATLFARDASASSTGARGTFYVLTQSTFLSNE